MIRKIIICGMFYICLLGCHKESSYKNRYTLKSVNDSINIKIGSRSRNLSFSIQYLPFNDSNYLAVLTEKFNSVEIYNLDAHKLFNIIETKKEGNNAFPGMMGFVMKDIDTMLAIGTYPRFVGIINGKGEVLRKIPWNKSNIGRFIEPMIPIGPYRPVIKGSTVSISLLTNTHESNGILTSTKKDQSNLHVDIDLNTGESKLFPFTYPDELLGKDISGLHICRVLGYNNCYVYSFNMIDGLFISNENLSFEKIPLETNYKLKLIENHWEYMADMIAGMRYNLAHDEIEDICFDKFRECYYLIVRKRDENPQNNIDYRATFLYPDCFIIILDKNLKFMGEVNLPDNTYSFKMTFVAPKGLYISEDHINNPSYNEDYLRFRLLTLEKL